MRSLQIVLALFFTFATLSVSDPGSGDPFGRELLAREALPQRPTSGQGDPLVGDQTPTSTDAEPTETGKADSTNKSDKSNAKSNAKTTSKADKTDSADSSATGDSTKKGSSTKKASSTRKTRIPATAQAGLVNMKTPAPTAGFSIFKIGEIVTFGWNYTNLVIPPSNINVEAYCTDGANYFTITGNASGDTTKAIWDTGKYQSTASIKLPIATYTLFIYDASKSRTDVPDRGYLAPYQNTRFGMYVPKKATPLSEFECPTCSPDDATALMNRYVLRMSIFMAFVSALSFTWFMAGSL